MQLVYHSIKPLQNYTSRNTASFYRMGPQSYLAVNVHCFSRKWKTDLEPTQRLSGLPFPPQQFQRVGPPPLWFQKARLACPEPSVWVLTVNVDRKGFLVVRPPISQSFGQRPFLDLLVCAIVLGLFCSALLGCVGSDKETGRLSAMMFLKSQCPQAAQVHLSAFQRLPIVVLCPRFFSCLREHVGGMGVSNLTREEVSKVFGRPKMQ